MTRRGTPPYFVVLSISHPGIFIEEMFSPLKMTL